MDNIYVIIVTYNGMQWIDKCLCGLQQSKVWVNVVIVDNCSKDGTVAYVKSTYPYVLVLPQEKNLGFGQANNVGIRYAMGHNADYVMLLNQDVTVRPDTIQLLLEEYKKTAASLLSPIHLNGDGSRLDKNFKKNTILCDDGKMLVDDLLISGYIRLSSYKTLYVNAACWFLPIETIKAIGGFNPLFFHYGEDVNYLQRLHFHKKEIRIVPASFMYHDREQFGNKAIAERKYAEREMLLAQTNVNYSRKERFLAQLKVLMSVFYKGNVKESLLLLVFNFMLFLSRKPRKSRKKEKCLGANWLDL